MKTRCKTLKTVFSVLVIIFVAVFSITTASAAVEKYTDIVTEQYGYLYYEACTEYKFTLNYNSKVKISFIGLDDEADLGTDGDFLAEIKNSSGEVVFSKEDESYYDDIEYITDVLPKDEYTFVLTGLTSYDFTEYFYSLSYTVTEDIPVEKINLNFNDIYLCETEKQQLKATPEPLEANVDISWSSSDTKVATVTDDGLVVAQSTGNAVITATVGNLKSQCNVTVFSTSGKKYQSIVTKVNGKIKNTETVEKQFTLNAYSKVKISFTGLDYDLDYETYGDYTINIKNSDGDVVYTVSSYSSYDDKSHVTGVLPKGNYTFVLSVDRGKGDLDYCYSLYSMVVENIKAKSVKLSQTSAYFCKGDTVKLKATVNPSYAVGTVKWSTSDKSIATVSSSGVVTAKSPGKATVTATIDGKKATCKITVFSTTDKVYKTIVSKQTGTLYEGQSKKSSFTLKSYSRVKIFFLGWSENDGKTYGGYDVQIKDEAGKVVYKTKGDASYDDISLVTPVLTKGKYTLILRAEADDNSYYTNDLDYSYTVSYMTVADVKINKLKINYPTLSLTKGKTKTLKVSTDPSYITRKITWSTSDKNVATVNSKGVVTAKNLGIATITAKVGDKKITCKLTVSATSATVIKKMSASMTSYTANIKNMSKATWSSSNTSIATVDKKGKVTGKGYGSCNIYCKVSGTTYTFKITVKPAVSISYYDIDDTSVYNELWLKFTNNTGKKVTYVTFNIYQYDNRGYRLSSPYKYYYVNDTINGKSYKIYEFWVNDDTMKASCSLTKVWFSDGTTWTP